MERTGSEERGATAVVRQPARNGVTAGDESLAALLHTRAGARPRATAFRYKSLGLWHDVTWRELAGRVADLAVGLRRAGLEAGAVVAVVGDPSPDWLVAIAAVHGAGAVPFCLYQGIGMGEAGRLLREHAAGGIVVDGVDWLAALAEAGEEAPGRVILAGADSAATWAGRPVLRLAELEQSGRERRQAEPAEWDRLREGRTGAEPAVLFATAAASGPARVVAHSSRGLRAAAQALIDGAGPRSRPLGSGDTAVVELPTGHVGAVVVGLLLPMLSGLVAHLPEQVVAEAVAEVRPTFSLSLGRTWERGAARIRVAGRGTHGFKGLVFRFAEGARRRRVRGVVAGLAYAFVLLPLLRKFGLERLRLALVLGPLAPEVIDLWLAWGVRLRPAHGTAETEPLSVFLEDDRESDLATGADGRTFSLAAVEASLRASPYLRGAVAVPEEGGGLVALLDLDFESIARWASAAGISYRTPAALRESEEVGVLIRREVAAANDRLAARGLPGVTSLALATRELAVGRELTPTWAVRRARVVLPEARVPVASGVADA